MLWKKSLDGVNVFLGVWLIASPWLIGVNSSLAFSYTAMILGICLAVLSAWALVKSSDAVPEWINMALGALLFVAPWAFRFTAVNAAWDAWFIGVATVAVAALTFTERRTRIPRQPGHSH